MSPEVLAKKSRRNIRASLHRQPGAGRRFFVTLRQDVISFLRKEPSQRHPTMGSRAFERQFTLRYGIGKGTLSKSARTDSGIFPSSRRGVLRSDPPVTLPA